MSNILVIKGHPLTSETSFSLKALDQFLSTYEAANPSDTITVLDVFADNVPEIDADIASAFNALAAGTEFGDLSADQQAKVGRFGELTDQFLAADKIVIANPLWNLSMPTRLKAWIDTINVAGKTFKYTAEGPVGLAGGKKVLHIQANGGAYNGNDASSQYLNSILNFIGIDDITSVYIEGHAYEPERANEILAAALAEVDGIAKTF
ncbi:NAD(P)H-dependent oxidoreductase [Lactococcus raffinolactis]|uniref:NAD(P)H-dependent oxidoreductase n=1 Tax=Pseudolactococcus raffinolactis TaxID=1366 RepID=UPI00077BFF18|nr:NAD(P)H-dependent oxidoreductase [Lactococcus raffinolactis]PCS09400.1 FMN-dependent NADH-azoreductase [Lactococcus raffinolactis]HBZ60603.1 FMN-dependent NADH-azoreductase [Lactococcus sp.]